MLNPKSLFHLSQNIVPVENQLSIASGSCNARVGLMGNPSDGFNGKTLSFLLKNFSAEVTIRELEGSSRIVIHPHPALDPNTFDSFEKLVNNTMRNGYYGGTRLIQAACKRFFELVKSSKIIDGNELLNRKRGFEILYDTDIPRMVGLSGSSAIIIATLRALLAFHGINYEDLGILIDEFPSTILAIEKEELNIAAGLQDRVIQVYGGLMHMDFSQTPPLYTKYPINLLPCLYLAYDISPSGESGKIHATIKERWENQESHLIAGMRTLGSYADAAVQCLQHENYNELIGLMESNFEMRRDLYTDAVVGTRNITAVQLAQKHGLVAKFTGSGGALVCISKDYNSNSGWLNQQKETSIENAFGKMNFKFIRMKFGETDEDN